MFTTNVNSIAMRFDTCPSLFSPSHPDRGTLALLSTITFEPEDKVLDLGCGYGLVGIYAAKIMGGERVWMLDNDPTALEFAKRNLEINEVSDAHVILSDGFRELKETNFTKVLFNPPYHADFSVPKHFIEKGFNRLIVGGTMFLVTKRKTWYMKKLTSIFGGCKVCEIDGYFVLQATKKSNAYANPTIDHRQPHHPSASRAL